MESDKIADTPMEYNFQVVIIQPAGKNLTYRELVGSVLYIPTVSKPDIALLHQV